MSPNDSNTGCDHPEVVQHSTEHPHGFSLNDSSSLLRGERTRLLEQEKTQMSYVLEDVSLHQKSPSFSQSIEQSVRYPAYTQWNPAAFSTPSLSQGSSTRRSLLLERDSFVRLPSLSLLSRDNDLPNYHLPGHSPPPWNSPTDSTISNLTLPSNAPLTPHDISPSASFHDLSIRTEYDDTTSLPSQSLISPLENSFDTMFSSFCSQDDIPIGLLNDDELHL